MEESGGAPAQPPEQNIAAANAMANVSASMQGEHVYDYIPDIAAAVRVQDVENTSRQADMDESMAYECAQDPADISVNENTAYECNQDPAIPVEENRAYAGFAPNSDIPVDNNRAYECAHSPDIQVCDTTKDTHSQVHIIPVGDNRENSRNAQDTDIPVNADMEHGHKQEILMNDNEAYGPCSEPTVEAMKANKSYNYRQPFLTHNIAYDESLSVTVESARV